MESFEIYANCSCLCFWFPSLELKSWRHGQEKLGDLAWRVRKVTKIHNYETKLDLKIKERLSIESLDVETKLLSLERKRTKTNESKNVTRTVFLFKLDDGGKDFWTRARFRARPRRGSSSFPEPASDSKEWDHFKVIFFLCLLILVHNNWNTQSRKEDEDAIFRNGRETKTGLRFLPDSFSFWVVISGSGSTDLPPALFWAADAPKNLSQSWGDLELLLGLGSRVMVSRLSKEELKRLRSRSTVRFPKKTLSNY